MTVKELIAELQKLNGDDTVVIGEPKRDKKGKVVFCEAGEEVMETWQGQDKEGRFVALC